MVSCLSVSASFLAPGSSDQSLQHGRVHFGGLMGGHSAGGVQHMLSQNMHQ